MTHLNKPDGRRFLFSVAGGYGHLHPLMPLAGALRQAGHAVAFAVSPNLRSPVEAAGFAVLPVGGRAAADGEYREVQAQLAAMPLNLDTEIFNYTRVWCGITPRLRAPELMAVARDWQPHLLIREAGEYGAVLAAEHLGLPHATVAFAASWPGMARFERDAAAALDPIRARWGLPPDPALVAPYRYLHLSYAPPTFSRHPVEESDAPAPIPATTHFLRPDIFDQASAASLPRWIDGLPSQPTIYVTLGTEVNNEPGLYPGVLQTIIAGLRDLPITLIVTLGRDKDPADFGPQPANVHIEPYIPQSQLLPRCDLVVMHGGSNTLLAALDRGLPLVIIPFFADQFFNAHVAQRLHLGQVVPREALTPARIRAAVEAVLADPGYRQSVGRLQAEMHALPGQERAVALLEALT